MGSYQVCFYMYYHFRMPEFTDGRAMPPPDDVDAHEDGASPAGIVDMVFLYFSNLWFRIRSDYWPNPGFPQGQIRIRGCKAPITIKKVIISIFHSNYIKLKNKNDPCPSISILNTVSLVLLLLKNIQYIY